jgi:CRISPR/Cas system Type II protein with McrA/HNH and RuvC-like nuclease domain
MVKALLERMKDLGVRDLVLANVPAESQTLTALTRIARSPGFHIRDRERYNCGIIAFSDTAQRQDILQALLQKEKEKRELKKLNQLGQIRIQGPVVENN